jgi:aminomethyltransferase
MDRGATGGCLLSGFCVAEFQQLRDNNARALKGSVPDWGIVVGHLTPLALRHLKLGARLVDFGGWDMPLHYGSQLEEHHAVRRGAGVFDVSHMRVIDLEGSQTREFLRYLLANDVGKLTAPGQALYSTLLNTAGGILDDLIVYACEAGRYRLIVNAGTADADVAWIQGLAWPYRVQVTERRDLAILAVQGPEARERVASLLPAASRAAILALKPFCGRTASVLFQSKGTPADCKTEQLRHGDNRGATLFIARTGYTGEDGFEILVPADYALELWDALVDLDVRPCGLGARDTLRLEAGLNLYGQDMDSSVTPFDAGLGWTVSLSEARRFVGRPALEAQLQRGSGQRFVGLVLEAPGVLRARQRVIVPGMGVGFTTSGGYSPTLDRSIALARVPAGTGERVEVEIRGKTLPARVVQPPFVRHGRTRVLV